MTPPRPTLVVVGQVVIAFAEGGVQTAEAIGIADGRVVAVGSRDDVLEAKAPGARLVAAGDAAIIPGVHDAHLHLVGMARAQRITSFEGVERFDSLLAELRNAAARVAPDGWVLGSGWSGAVLAAGPLERLEEAVGERPALLSSHDTHSVWASAAALRLAGIRVETADPPGGRIERRTDGSPNGLLREAATDLVDVVAPRLGGPALDAALDEVLGGLAGLGVTGATDAGDSAVANGIGTYAALGDSASVLLGARGRLDGRLRLSVNVPAAVIGAASVLGLRTGELLPGTETIRTGWAKAFADGALGSRTAALFDPYRDDASAALGILQLDLEALAAIAAAARAAGIGLATHAIGDRAVATALDALATAPPSHDGVPADRIEHVQLARPADVARFGAMGVTASVQPVHVVSDRQPAEASWSDRLSNAYPWRSLVGSGAVLALGTDAPVESPNPWRNLFAAIHRRAPLDGLADWLPDEALDPITALGAATRGPALAMGRPDEGHLGVGAVADLAVLNVGLETLLAGNADLAHVRSELTLVDGREVRLG